MAVKHLKVEEVKQAFADAIPFGEPFDQMRWDNLYRLARDPMWQSASDGIELLQVDGARLVRVRWEFAIDKMDTSSEANLCSSAVALREQLCALLNRQPVSFDRPKSEVEEELLTVVKCWTQGIIG